MCNLYSITTNQEAIIRLFRVLNRYIGDLPPMPGVFPDYPAPVVRNADGGRELAMMRWGILFLFGMLSNGFGPHCYYSPRGEEHCPSADDE